MNFTVQSSDPAVETPADPEIDVQLGAGIVADEEHLLEAPAAGARNRRWDRKSA